MIGFLKNKLLSLQIKKAVQQAKQEKSETYAEQLIASRCKWLKLYWNGEEKEFLIYQIDFPELLACGRFPNVLYGMCKGLGNALKMEVPPVPESDLKALAEEEKIFNQELVKKSLVNPTYEQLAEGARKKLPQLAPEDITFDVVIPKDFTTSLYYWYLNEWAEGLKKKSETVLSSGSAESQNTGGTGQASTSRE